MINYNVWQNNYKSITHRQYYTFKQNTKSIFNKKNNITRKFRKKFHKKRL